MKRLALITALVLTLTGCAPAGPRDTPRSAPPAGGLDSGPPPLPDSSAPALPVPPEVTPVPGRRDRTVPWRLVGRRDGDRTLLLEITIGGPPCDAVTAVAVAEATATVSITVYAGVAGQGRCGPGVQGSVGTFRVPARLAQPLGARTLKNGP
jgi:hypothetical protein